MDFPTHPEEDALLASAVDNFENQKMDGSTHSGRVESSAGGVGRNIADCLSRLKMNPFFISAVSSGFDGSSLLGKMSHMDITGIQIVPDSRTAVCTVFLEHNGNCLFVVGDMDIHNRITAAQIMPYESLLSKAPLVIIDGNVPIETINYTLNFCSNHHIPVWFEPTDINKAWKPFMCEKWRESLVYASPNRNELRVMHDVVTTGSKSPTMDKSYEKKTNLKQVIDECLELSLPLMETISTLVVTLDSFGTLLITRQLANLPFPMKNRFLLQQNDNIRAIHFSPPKPSTIVSVSGAGDCFAAAMIGGILRQFDQESCIRIGQKAALLSCGSHQAVPETITEEIFSSISDLVSYPKPQIIQL